PNDSEPQSLSDADDPGPVAEPVSLPVAKPVSLAVANPDDSCSHTEPDSFSDPDPDAYDPGAVDPGTVAKSVDQLAVANLFSVVDR
ncbi:MAG TPA: hypothetical protein VK662_14890, partial [Acidothermaceae bacterium]|nr:hypothetical protein [Acidothermaceae bacterium]